MLIYRFRITSEDYDDFLRVIEIQPNQTFLDFHEQIMASSDIDKCDKAFFYITDNKFKKKKEITLKPIKNQVKKYDDELDEMVTEIQVPHLMKEAKINESVEDPHQRMIYEFHGKESVTLFIELFKIIKTDENISLPRCIQSKGEIPKKLDVKSTSVTAPPEEEAAIHLPLVAPGGASLFSNIHEEDESELAEIENQLGDILAGAEQESEDEKPALLPDDEATYSLHQDSDSDEEEGAHLESLDEYDDIENLEIKHRDFDRDSDDY
jgi:hypothetical protein